MGEAKRRKSLDPNYGKNPIGMRAVLDEIEDRGTILTDKEVVKTIEILTKTHGEAEESLLIKAIWHLNQLKLDGMLFEMAMNGEIDFRVGRSGKLEFGIETPVTPNKQTK